MSPPQGASISSILFYLLVYQLTIYSGYVILFVQIIALYGNIIKRFAQSPPAVFGIFHIPKNIKESVFPMNMYLAHVSDGRVQHLADHLHGTAAAAERFAAVFGEESAGKICGLLHDIGKYTPEFQRRLHGDSRQTDHSTAGALEALCLLKDPIISMCIAGHHTGLMNIGGRYSRYKDGTFKGRMTAKAGKDIPDYSCYKEEIKIGKDEYAPSRQKDCRDAFFYTHMLYSCLVDADFLDTEAFMSDNTAVRGGYSGIDELSRCLDRYIKPWMTPKNELNRKRCEILNSLISAASCPRGLFTLTVPTGGGKTVSSMAFALRHALANITPDEKPLRRVIYIIPYISIIEQTQAVFEKIFGEENVIAHYANTDFADNDDGIGDRKKLAAENWDAPIILTTAVQFFESLFANRPSSCRKLHNIAGSVLIFDEAQMMPTQYLEPCLYAISELVKNYCCSAVLCSATKPPFGRMPYIIMPGYPMRELCPDPEGMYDFFRRVTYKNDGTLTPEELSGRLCSREQVLCIVNTKRLAHDVFNLISGEGSYHLSTSMIPFDRRRVLDDIRSRLASGQSCRVVSTSLIEAGVDIDFPEVYREYAGLDSIIQSGGRCNREGKRRKEDSFVHYFKTGAAIPQYIRQNVSAAEYAMRSCADIASPAAIDEYFSFLLYTLKDKAARDVKGIMDNIDEHSDFADIAAEFRIIDDSGCTVIIPEGDGEKLAALLKQYGVSRGLLRKAGQYAVSVYDRYFDSLISSGKADLISDRLAVLTDMSIYKGETGLELKTQDDNALIF